MVKFGHLVGWLSVAAMGLPLCCTAALQGSCESEARNVYDETSFTLVNEYDEDQGVDIPSNHVYYFKTTLKRLVEYTVWLEDKSGKLIDDGSVRIDNIYPADSTGDTFPATAQFWTTLVGNSEYYWLPKEEWTYDPSDPEMNDPASWPYYILISGVEGGEGVLRFRSGLHLPKGCTDNPVMLNPRADVQTVVKTDNGDNEMDLKLRGGEFYVGAVMKRSCKYLFSVWSKKSAEEEELSFAVQGEGRSNEYAHEKAPPVGEGYTGWMSYVPLADDGTDVSPYTKALFSAMTNAHVQVEVIDGGKTNLVWTNMLVNAMSSTADFKIAYAVLPQRTIAEHGPKALDLGASVEITPGHLANPAYYAYDDIIDDNLFKIETKKGKRYVVGTEGAKTNLLLRVYDAAGNILYENTDSGDGYECRVAFEADKTRTCYVGVCQKLKDDDVDEILGESVRLFFESAEPVDGTPDEWDAADDLHGGATGLVVMPGKPDEAPEVGDKEGHGLHGLGRSDWTDTFMIGGRKGLTYQLRVTLPEGAGQVRNTLEASVFTASGKKLYGVSTRGDINPGSVTGLTFRATANQAYYVQLYVKEGLGYEYPKYRLHAVGYDDKGTKFGVLQVTPQGAASATWKIDKETAKYPAGASVLLPANGYTVTYTAVAGFTAPAKRQVWVKAGEVSSYSNDLYTDKFDPKDDACAGKGTDPKTGKAVSYAATAWALKNAETVQERTLWHDDPADNFSFAAKDGCYYDFALTRRNLTNETCDAVFSITNATPSEDCPDGIFAKDVTDVHQLVLPAVKTKYILTVYHKDPAEQYNSGSYALTGLQVNPGYVKFAKTAVTVKDNAASVKLTVNRTQKEGQIRVAYETIDGSAVNGTNYVGQSGYLTWEAGDKKAKTIEVKLIPKLRAFYEGGVIRDFRVRLHTLAASIPPEELEYEEYPTKVQLSDKAKTLADEDFAMVTITESAKKTLTDPMANYKPVKVATVKTEVSPLRAGTFFGVLSAPVKVYDGGAPNGEVSSESAISPSETMLTNGYPALASVTLTVAAKDKKDLASTEKDTISASVSLAGKKYAFKPGKGEKAWDGEDEFGRKVRRLEQVLTVNKVKYTNVLEIAVCDGISTNGTDWILASGGTNSVTLTMNVPDAKNKSVQTNIVYRGEVYRDFSKVQDYLNAVTNFVGYYTTALVPPKDVADTGIPSGNGYLCITVDNKGKAKLTGKLVDGSAVSLSAVATRLRKDATSANGYSLEVPVYVSKKPYCMGGVLRLFAEKTLDYDRVTSNDVVKADSGSLLAWYNDDATLSYDNIMGFSYSLTPVGGYFDTVINLQSYYIRSAFQVDTTGAISFPAEMFTYTPVETGEANGTPVDVNLNAFAVAKKQLVKDPDTKAYDFEDSVNPANVQVKLARATGLVSGSFSIWTEGVKDDGSIVQKNVTGPKHYGVLLLSRDAKSLGGDDSDEVLPAGIASAGFFQTSVKVTDSATNKKRTWKFSGAFNIKDIAGADSESKD